MSLPSPHLFKTYTYLLHGALHGHGLADFLHHFVWHRHVNVPHHLHGVRNLNAQEENLGNCRLVLLEG